MSGGSTYNAPDPDPNIGRAAMKQAELGERYLDIAERQNAIQNQRQARMDQLTERIANQQIAAQDRAMQWAAEDRQRYKSVFQPLQDEFIRDARGWDSEERQAKVAAEASAAVRGQAAIEDAARQRQMASMGINPTSGRYAGIERAADTATALAAAGAENNARNQVRKEAMALRGDAINLGSGLGVNPATSLGLGVQSGSAAANTTAAAMGTANQNLAALGSAYGVGMQGYANQANILGNLYGQQLNAWSAAQQASAAETGSLFSGIGSIAGAAMILSDEETKEDREPSKGNLEKIKRLPVEDWNYKEGTGEDPEPRHTGTMAQDFKRVTGRGDGKTIHIADAIGVTMGAVKELAGQVDQIRRDLRRRGRGIMPSAA